MSPRLVADAGAETHLAYPTSLRAFCGLPLAELADVPGRTRAPTCGQCAAADARLALSMRAWGRTFRSTFSASLALDSALRMLGLAGEGLSGSLRHP